MTRLRFSTLLLLLASAAGCAHSIAVTGDPQVILPEKTPGDVESTTAEPAADNSTKFPRVVLSTIHTKWCNKFVGDAFPAIQLPRLDQGQSAEISSFQGSQATIVVFWTQDRWMSQMALEDLQQELASSYDPAEVSIVGIAVKVAKREVQQIVANTQAEFPHLLDNEGKALAEVGSVAMPRIYVLDPSGKIVWFDIEYSESTRRELLQTVATLAGQNSTDAAN